MAEPLLSMLRSKEFQWGPSERQSFQDLKLALTTPPVLSIPTCTELFILDTDASGFTVAAEPGPRWSGRAIALAVTLSRKNKGGTAQRAESFWL